jgi:RNA polymerase sigma factor (sigma-70 family)
MEASRAGPRLRLLRPPADRAFEQLYERHAREVYQYALVLLANPTDAEDVTQTTFLNAYRAFQRGERPRKPHNWLIAITHNVCRMRWRQAGARPREVALDEAPEPVANEQERPNVDEVLTALAGLSFNQRAALVMRELEGRSYQEISDVLGVSVSAVEALLFRARRSLRIHRKGLGVITTVPLPGSLTSFLGGGGGGAVAVGGTAIGADIVLKAAAVVVASAVTAGIGYKGVAILASSPRAMQPAQAAAAKQHRASASVRATRGSAKKAAPNQRLRQATPAGAKARPDRATAPAQPGAPAQQPPAASAAAVTAPLAPALPNVAPPAISVPTPNLPPPPQLPPAPQLPPVPPAPALPPVPPVPPAPSLPPVPPLPITVPVPPVPPVLP